MTDAPPTARPAPLGLRRALPFWFKLGWVSFGVYLFNLPVSAVVSSKLDLAGLGQWTQFTIYFTVTTVVSVAAATVTHEAAKSDLRVGGDSSTQFKFGDSIVGNDNPVMEEILAAAEQLADELYNQKF